MSEPPIQQPHSVLRKVYFCDGPPDVVPIDLVTKHLGDICGAEAVPALSNLVLQSRKGASKTVSKIEDRNLHARQLGVLEGEGARSLNQSLAFIIANL